MKLFRYKEKAAFNYPFNRTTEELKQVEQYRIINDTSAFNRTTEELKLFRYKEKAAFNYPFNRTTEELKLAFLGLAYW